MTQAEADQALQEGHKITHRFFLDYEYLHLVDGNLVDENGFSMWHFWRTREGEMLDGWSIFKESQA
jgi:hypothetical protein